MSVTCHAAEKSHKKPHYADPPTTCRLYNLYGLTRVHPRWRLAQDVQREIGKKVRALRLERGLKQDVFGEKAGLNRAHVGEIERGESNVTIQTLKLIADTLKVKIEDLVRGL